MNSIKKTDHFYLIDGSGYIFRAYYALPPLSRKSDGLPTGAVSGFCNMLFKLLQDATSEQNESKPTHFAVIFDFTGDAILDYLWLEIVTYIVLSISIILLVVTQIVAHNYQRLVLAR